MILMGEVKKSLNRRVSFLVCGELAEAAAIGFLASFFMAIGVVRPQDNLKPARGTIRVDPEDYKKLIGHDTHFLTDCAPRGLIVLPKSMGFRRDPVHRERHVLDFEKRVQDGQD